MTFLDFFAGIGGFRLGLEQAGHQCVGFCEYDKFATMSYIMMHIATEEQIEYLKTLTLHQRQKEILKDGYRNNEWYSNDVRTVQSSNIPKADIWCFGFPCQDISSAGKQRGFVGERSSLFFRIMQLIAEQKEENKPSILFIENVKNLLSINRGWDFARLLMCLDENGYDAEWQVIDSAEQGGAQHRERLYIIGHLRERNTKQIFPVERENESAGIQQIGNIEKPRKNWKNPSTGRIFSVYGIAPTLLCRDANGHAVKILVENDNEKRIRTLTPKEYFRLQGFPDEYFNKAQLVNSNSQLYKQAGNSVSVYVIKKIAQNFMYK